MKCNYCTRMKRLHFPQPRCNISHLPPATVATFSSTKWQACLIRRLYLTLALNLRQNNPMVRYCQCKWARSWAGLIHLRMYSEYFCMVPSNSYCPLAGSSCMTRRWRKQLKFGVHILTYLIVALGFLEVIIYATGPKDCGLKPRRGRWNFKDNKNP
jgi:hypothetical protein